MGRLILKSIVFLALLPFVLELSVRLLLPQQLIVYDDFYVTDYTGLGVRPAANLDIIVNTGEGDARLLTDEWGYRIGIGQPKNPDRRILAMGDSYLLAVQVDYEQTMTALLEQRLSDDLGQRTTIVNSGNAASDVNHYRILLKQELVREQYDVVMVFINGSNDIVEKEIGYFEPVATHKLQLRTPQSATRAELTQALLYPINDWLERNSHLFILGKNRASILLSKLGLTAFYFPEELLKSEADSTRWETTASILADLQSLAEQHETKILFIVLPSIYQIEPDRLQWAQEAFAIDSQDIDLEQPYNRLRDSATQYGVATIDLLSPLRTRYSDTDQQEKLYGEVDTHLSAEGHRAVADLLAPTIKSALEDNEN